MKKLFKIQVVLTIAMLMTSTLFAKKRSLFPTELNTEVKQVFPLADLNYEMTKELLEGKHPHMAIECREGVDLPFKYFGNFGLFSVNFAPNLSIKIEKTCYLRFVQKNRFNGKKSSTSGYISFDLKKWEKIKDVQAKQLNINFGMSNDKSHILLKTSPVEKLAPLE